MRWLATSSDDHASDRQLQQQHQQHLHFAAQAVSQLTQFFVGTGAILFTLIAVAFSSFRDFVFGIAVFVACLYYLLVSKEFFLDKLVDIIPVADPQTISSSLRRSVNGIFLSSLAICLSHALVTYLFFSLCDFNFIFLATLFTAVSAIFPVLSSWLVLLPVLFVLYFQQRSYWWLQIAAFLAAKFTLLWFSDPYIYSKIPHSHPYITGISIFSGIYTFGLEGVLIGPMLVILTVTIYDIMEQQHHHRQHHHHHRLPSSSRARRSFSSRYDNTGSTGNESGETME